MGIRKMGLMLALVAIGAPGASYGQDMNELLRRKYDILEQQADTEARRAEAERMRAETETDRANNQRPSEDNRPTTTPSTSTYSVPEGDALAGTDAPICKLGNGTSIRVTGGLRRPAGVQCTSGE